MALGLHETSTFSDRFLQATLKSYSMNKFRGKGGETNIVVALRGEEEEVVGMMTGDVADLIGRPVWDAPMHFFKKS